MEKKDQRLQLLDLSRTLDAHEVEFMPKMVYKLDNGKVMAQVLAYKNARTDMNILDEVVGCGNWQNRYERDSKGVLQCGIGVFVEERGEWVWKWSNGIESNMEKQKGEYSDAMKRAGYMWGIGRCLYTFPSVWIQLMDHEWREESGIVKMNNSFKPKEFDWDLWIDLEGTGEYEQIIATDKRGNIRFHLEPHKQKFKDPENKQNR